MIKIKQKKVEEKVPETYNLHTAPLNVPLKIAYLSKVNNYTKFADIVIVLKDQADKRFLLITDSNFTSKCKLHQPGYDILLVPADQDTTIEITGESNEQ